MCFPPGWQMVVFLVFWAAVSSAGASVELTLQLDGPTEHFPHNWEECVGSGHMTLALRSDYREQLRRCHDELGFKRVRMHGMMDDDMSTSQGPGINSFLNLDSVIDFVSSIGMDVLFEIGFMPEWLASNSTHIFHYNGNTSPPKNYTLWAQTMEDLASHLVQRYGVDMISKWFFEVWNEPTIGFWSGVPNQQTYFELYETTAKAFHRVSPQFQLGGPVSNSLQWIPEFLAFCNSTRTPVSFVSSHLYAGGDNNGTLFDAKSQAQQFATAHAQVGGKVPFIVSEWGGTYSHDLQLDDPSYAAYIISAVAANVHNADIFSFWAFSDVFEENGMPTGAYVDHPNFGLLNPYGIPKPSYRAFQLLHWAGDRRVNVLQTNPAGSCGMTVSGLGLRNSSHFSLFVTNTAPLPLSGAGWADNVTDCVVEVRVPATRAMTTVIDATHSNPKAVWQEMGSPAYLSQAQIMALERASQLQMQTVAIHDYLNVTVPARSVFALFAEIEPSAILV